MEMNILYVAIAVFVLLVIGLTLTVLEFKYGAPNTQEELDLKPTHPGR